MPVPCHRLHATLAITSFYSLLSFMQLTAKELYENQITWRDIFTDVPIRIANSPLVTALMCQIDEHVQLGAIDATRLRMGTQPFLEKQLERIGDGIDNLHMEVQDISAYERARARQEQQKAIWLARRQEVRCMNSWKFHWNAC